MIPLVVIWVQVWRVLPSQLQTHVVAPEQLLPLFEKNLN